MISIVISISPLTTIYLWHGIWDDSFHNCLTASPYSVNVIPSLIIDYINYLSYFPTKITTVHAKLLQSCPTPCDLMNHSLPGSSVHRILQVRLLEWVAIPFSGDLPNSGIELQSPALQVDFFFFHLSH